MPDEQKEIWRLELDPSQMERAVQRVLDLTEQIKAKRAAGGDATALEAELQTQVDFLRQLQHEKKQDANATQDLMRAKGQLAAVVNLLGGSFGGLIGQLGGVIQLLTTMAPTAIAAGAALAAIAIGKKYFEDIKRAAEEAAKAQEAYNDAVREGQSLKMGTTQSMAEQLEKWGARSQENVKAATEMRDALQKTYGVSEQEAAQAAALAAGAGLSTKDAARLSVLLGGGAQIGTPEQAQQALEAARQKGSYDKLLDAAVEHSRDAAGRGVRKAAMAPGFGGTGEMTPVESAYEALKNQPGGFEAAGLPADFTLEQFRAGLSGDAMEIARSLFLSPGKKQITQKEYEEAKKIQEAMRGWAGKLTEQHAAIDLDTRAIEPPPVSTEPTGETPSGAVVQQTVNHYHETNNIGTQYNAPDRRNARHWVPHGMGGGDIKAD
jgi:hypothetical protein